MKLFANFLQNHVLANLTFVLVLVIGGISYMTMPREQDPTVNFNWIQVTTILPGASAEDVEKRVTDPLEEVIRKVKDVRFVTSNSRPGASGLLVRFEDIDEHTFDKRVTDLRREIQNKQDELPQEIVDPDIQEITTANAFPTATIVVTSPADDENLRRQSEIIRKELERIKGVDQAQHTALHDPELQVHFDPKRIHQLGVRPSDLANTVEAYFRDTPAGTRKVGGEDWLVRLEGTSANAQQLARLPILTAEGVLPLEAVAEVRRGREEAERLVSFEGLPAVMFGVTKKEDTNTLELVARLDEYVNTRNLLAESTGVHLVLANDQTEITRKAIYIMQTNAALGLALVLLVAWLFLGLRIAFLVSIGIPFVLSGLFWVLQAMGQTLNVMVLLGVVIALGMLVDDAVVVVENIHYRLNRGKNRLEAILEALREVVPPVTTSVMTTIAAFLPLLLLPGIVGKFMRQVPMVVTIALTLSLVECYWMLPSHLLTFKTRGKVSKSDNLRRRANRKIRLVYTRLLIMVLRYSKTSFGVLILIFALSISAVLSGWVRNDFFASDPLRLFYVNVEMPTGSPIDKTLRQTVEVEHVIRSRLSELETRAVISYAGQMYTDMEPVYGDRYGQVQVSLKPKTNDMLEVDEVIEQMRADVLAVSGPLNIYFQRMDGGPPTSKPISIKVRGDNFSELDAGVAALIQILKDMDGVYDISDNAPQGRGELNLSFNLDAMQRYGIDPARLSRDLRLLVDGEVVAAMQDNGEELEVRVRAKPEISKDVHELTEIPIAYPNSSGLPLGELLNTQIGKGPDNIRHYNFRRSITVEADLDSEKLDTVMANKAVVGKWAEIATQHPNVSLDFTGELDDIQESLDAISKLFLLGIGLMYLIIGTQFRSYFQPFLIISTVPMAFTGVVLGLLITRQPLSLFTLYGVVALAGIAVNGAIVLISAANSRLRAGMTVTHAAVYAARRRVIPIMITTLTTIAGLSSLAMGLGGKSLTWGPVAISIVWGLAFSSLLTLFAIPVLYRLFVRAHKKTEH